MRNEQFFIYFQSLELLSNWQEMIYSFDTRSHVSRFKSYKIWHRQESTCTSTSHSTVNWRVEAEQIQFASHPRVDEFLHNWRSWEEQRGSVISIFFECLTAILDSVVITYEWELIYTLKESILNSYDVRRTILHFRFFNVKEFERRRSLIFKQNEFARATIKLFRCKYLNSREFDAFVILFSNKDINQKSIKNFLSMWFDYSTSADWNFPIFFHRLCLCQHFVDIFSVDRVEWRWNNKKKKWKQTNDSKLSYLCGNWIIEIIDNGIMRIIFMKLSSLILSLWHYFALTLTS